MPLANSALSPFYNRDSQAPESGATSIDSMAIIAPDRNPDFLPLNFEPSHKPAWEGYIRVEEPVQQSSAGLPLDSWRATARVRAFEKLCERCDSGVDLSVTCTIREEWRHASATSDGGHLIPASVGLVVVCELTYRIEEK